MKRVTFLTKLRGRVPRFTSALVLAASFLLAAGGDVLGQHACPHHDMVPGSAEHHSAPAAADSDHAHHGGVPHAEPESRPDDEHAPCNCIGECHGSAASPLPPSGSAVAAAPAGAERTSSAPSVSNVVVRLLSHVLPFANGPPAHV